MFAVRKLRHRGLRVMYQHKPGPLTGIALSIRAGARFDGAHPGIAHMAEHMLFQGTDSLDQLALNRTAAELGGEHNADTGYETISLTIEVFNEDVGSALKLLADQYYRSTVGEARFRKERRVVLDEVRGRLDDPMEHLHSHAWRRFFDGAISQPVWGSMRSLKTMEASHITAFLRRHFVHAATAIGIVGGVSERAAASAVTRHFGAGGSRKRRRVPRVRGGADGALRLRSGGGQAGVLKMIAVPPQPRMLLAVGLALDMVGSDPDSRLFQEIRERLGLGYDVSAALDWGPDWAVASVSASTGRRSADRLRRTVEHTCKRAADEGFTDDEVARAKKKLRYRYASLAESRLDRALSLAEGTLLGFPLPEESQKIISRIDRTEIEKAWRTVLAGRILTAVCA
jgi:predicted Zn-dependent peptidase